MGKLQSSYGLTSAERRIILTLNLESTSDDPASNASGNSIAGSHHLRDVSFGGDEHDQSALSDSCLSGIVRNCNLRPGNRVFSEHPVVMLGGNVRLWEGVAILLENWFIAGGDFELSEQPFSIGLRFFGERVAGDIAFILIGKVLEEGFPIPWLSLTYNFGR